MTDKDTSAPDAGKHPLKDYKPVYVVAGEKTEDGRLIARGKLKHGIEILGVKQHDFEMVGFMTSDMFAAESEVSAETPLQFNAVLMCQVLKSIGTYKGPFTLNLIGRARPGDYQRLRAAQTELEILGEAE